MADSALPEHRPTTTIDPPQILLLIGHQISFSIARELCMSHENRVASYRVQSEAVYSVQIQTKSPVKKKDYLCESQVDVYCRLTCWGKLRIC